MFLPSLSCVHNLSSCSSPRGMATSTPLSRNIKLRLYYYISYNSQMELEGKVGLCQIPKYNPLFTILKFDSARMKIMSWQIYLIISICIISFNGLLQRSLMKDEKSHAEATAIAGLGLSGLLAILIAFIQRKLNLFFPVSLSRYLILFMLLVTPGYLLSRHAYKLIGASEMVIILATGRLWNVIGAYLFLHEKVTMLRVLGAVIILLGVAVARFEKRKFIVNKGVFLALFAAFFLGMSDIVGYYILKSMNATNFLIYSYFLPVFAIILFQPKVIKKLSYFLHLDKGMKLLFLSLCDVFGMLALYLSYQAGGAASIIGPLSSTRVLVTTGLAMLILRERNNTVNKLIGAVVTVIGVILLL